MNNCFDKYHYYTESVQSPDEDVRFLSSTAELLTGRTPKVLGEDFCGTFRICTEWVKLNKDNRAIGVDLSEEPLMWGKEHNLPLLNSEEKSRINILQKDVLNPDLPKVDVLAAMNFSYYIFKKREELRAYFKNVHGRLNEGGLFFADCFGGTDISDDVEEEVEHDGFTYFWHQETFDPISNSAIFHIHFQLKGEEKREKVFTYDWRMWSIPEIREIMIEAGFSKTRVFWEKSDVEGEGSGDFFETESGESCAGWIGYVVGHK